MKLLSHEKYLILLMLVFIPILFAVSFFSHKEPNIISATESVSTPYYIDINTATADELTTLDGIGPAIAERIINFREKNGNFKNPEDLCKVPGIGSSTLNKIKDYIVISQGGSK